MPFSIVAEEGYCKFFNWKKSRLIFFFPVGGNKFLVFNSNRCCYNKNLKYFNPFLSWPTCKTDWLWTQQWNKLRTWKTSENKCTFVHIHSIQSKTVWCLEALQCRYLCNLSDWLHIYAINTSNATLSQDTHEPLGIPQESVG